MNGFGFLPSRWAPYLLSILRIVLAFMFLFHGTQKLFGYPPSDHPPVEDWLTMPGIAGILEFFGGVLVLIGLLTKPVAFLLSGQMAVAYWMVHAPNGGLPIQNGGEMAALYCFAWLYLAAAGGGPWSMDAMLGR